MRKILFFVSILAAISTRAQTDTCTGSAPRITINKPNVEAEQPYPYVCHVVFERRCHLLFFIKKTDFATCSFISPKILIGARHALDQSWTGIRKIQVKIYQHMENGREICLESKEISKKDFSLIRPFGKGGGNANDCGLIIFKNALVNKDSHFQLSTPEEARGRTAEVHLSGYPSILGDTDFDGKNLWQRNIELARTIVSASAKVIDYPCVRTALGDSGGPIWYKDRSVYYLVGTHVSGNPQTHNAGTGQALTKEKIAILQQLISTRGF
jgi:V8-like Glu-specific endopeptidase